MERYPKPANLWLVPHNFSYPRHPYEHRGRRHHDADPENGSTPLSPLSLSNPLSGGGPAAPSPESLASARSAGSTPSLVYDDRPESDISEIYDDECNYRTVPWGSFWPPGPSGRRLPDQDAVARGSDKLHDFHFDCSPERLDVASPLQASPLYHARDQLQHSPGSRTLSDCPIRPSTQPLPRIIPGPYALPSNPPPFCRPDLESSSASYTLFPKRIPLPPCASSLANLYQARAPQPQPLVLPRRPPDMSLLPPTLRHRQSDLQLPLPPALRRRPSDLPLPPPVLRHRQSDLQLPPLPALQRRPSDLPLPPTVLRHRQSDLQLPPPPALRRRPSELHLLPPPPLPLPHYQQHLQLTAAAAAAVAAATTAARERASPLPLPQSAFDSDSDDSDGADTARGLARLVRGLHRRSASESRRSQQQQQQRTRAGTISASAASTSAGPSPSPAPLQQDEGPRRRQGIDMFGRLLGRHSR